MKSVAFAAMKQGDELGAKIVDEYISYLASGVATMINIFHRMFFQSVAVYATKRITFSFRLKKRYLLKLIQEIQASKLKLRLLNLETMRELSVRHLSVFN